MNQIPTEPLSQEDQVSSRNALSAELFEIRSQIDQFNLEELHALVLLETCVRRTMDPLKVILIIEQILRNLGFDSEIHIGTSDAQDELPQHPPEPSRLRFLFSDYESIAGEEFAVCVDLAPLGRGVDISERDRRFLEFFCRQVGTVLAHQWLFQNLARTQEQLRSALSTVQEISAFVGHEIRSPLASLESLSFLMEDQVQELSRLERITDEDWKPFVDKMGQAGALLRKVVRSTYLLGTLEMDPSTFRKNLEWVEMGRSLLVSATSAYSFEIQRRKLCVTIRRESHFAHDYIHVHRAWFEAIFDNLLGNAVKYAVERGRIDFSILEKDGVYLIHVSNPVQNPPSAKRLNQLFQKGHRGGEAFRVNSIGANQGLGLYFVNRIVTLGYGGTVQVWVDEDRNRDGAEEEESVETQVFGNPETSSALPGAKYFHIEIKIPKTSLAEA